MSIKILPLSDALGAEISGFDWREPPNEETREAINQAFFRHHLLCLRAEPLTSVQFANVARYFGEPQLQLLRYQRHNEAPEVSILNSTYSTPEDKPDDLKMMRLTGWHTDDSYFAVPAKATMYQSLEIPGTGGETGFCNTRKAYQDLSEEMKKKLDGLQAVHSYDTIRTPAIAPNRTREEQAETPDVIHPLIRTHDDTGIKAIYFNANRTDRIVGMEREASDKLLDWLHGHMTQQKYQYWHHWRVGDILLWDNRCLVHAVNMDFPVGERRVYQRILLKGSVPV
jgi:taurine dioxygenase